MSAEPAGHIERSSRRSCERLWARHKYLVLSKSQASYRAIRAYLKSASPEQQELERLIAEAVALPEDRGAVINALQHVWGYFKRRVDEAEKRQFFALLGEYEHGRTGQSEVCTFLRELLKRYPDEYLNASSFLHSGRSDSSEAPDLPGA
ncbi:MAG: YbgA family protein [Bacillota bacterium]|nr:YbgA family protein [Bacillota bacterium]